MPLDRGLYLCDVADIVKRILCARCRLAALHDTLREHSIKTEFDGKHMTVIDELRQKQSPKLGVLWYRNLCINSTGVEWHGMDSL